MPLSPSSCSSYSTPIRLILLFSAIEVMDNPKSQGMNAGSGDMAQRLAPGSYYQGQHFQLPQYSTWTASSSLIPRYPITSSFTLFAPLPSLLPTSQFLVSIAGTANLSKECTTPDRQHGNAVMRPKRVLLASPPTVWFLAHLSLTFRRAPSVDEKSQNAMERSHALFVSGVNHTASTLVPKWHV